MLSIPAIRADNDVAVGLFEGLGFETVEVIEGAREMVSDTL